MVLPELDNGHGSIFADPIQPNPSTYVSSAAQFTNIWHLINS